MEKPQHRDLTEWTRDEFRAQIWVTATKSMFELTIPGCCVVQAGDMFDDGIVGAMENALRKYRATCQHNHQNA